MMSPDPIEVVATNRRAKYDYFLLDTYEAGLVLLGAEVKSVRSGRVQLREAHVAEKDGELWLINAHIAAYEMATRQSYDPVRPRKLLLHRRQINHLMGAVNRKGMTLLPLSIYFNKRGIAKVELALAEGKRKHDKRQTIKQRDWERQKARLLRAKR